MEESVSWIYLPYVYVYSVSPNVVFAVFVTIMIMLLDFLICLLL